MLNFWVMVVAQLVERSLPMPDQIPTSARIFLDSLI